MNQLQPTPQNPNFIARKFAAVGAGLALTFGAVACTDESKSEGYTYEIGQGAEDTTTTGTNPENTSIDSVPTSETTPTTAEQVAEAEETIDNVFNNSKNKFQCMDEGRDTGTMRVITLSDGTKTVGEVTLDNLDVDRNKRDQNHRLWTTSVANPITADPNDPEKGAMQLFATWCEQPAALASAVIDTVNDDILGITVGSRVDWLEPQVGKGVEDINDLADSLTIPHTGEHLTQEQFDENLKVTNARIALAEKMANAHLNMQNLGYRQNVVIESSLGLKLPDALDTSNTPEFELTTSYLGNVLLFGITDKVGDCVRKTKGYNYDDQRPLVVIDKVNECEPTITTVPSTTPGTRPEVAVPVVSQVIAGPGAGGTPDTDNNPDNNVTTSQKPAPSSSTSSTQVAGGDGNDNGSVYIP